jgi:hypothetical protein
MRALAAWLVALAVAMVFAWSIYRPAGTPTLYATDSYYDSEAEAHCYWDAETRRRHQVSIAYDDELVFASSGEPLSKNESYIYVLVPHFQPGAELMADLMVVSDSSEMVLLRLGQLFHTCMTRSFPVLAAGCLRMDKNDNQRWIWDNASGHYKPSPSSLLALHGHLTSLRNAAQNYRNESGGHQHPHQPPEHKTDQRQQQQQRRYQQQQQLQAQEQQHQQQREREMQRGPRELGRGSTEVFRVWAGLDCGGDSRPFSCMPHYYELTAPQLERLLHADWPGWLQQLVLRSAPTRPRFDRDRGQTTLVEQIID